MIKIADTEMEDTKTLLTLEAPQEALMRILRQEKERHNNRLPC